MFIAAAAERTKHIRLGTGVVSLPYHHPLMLADRIDQLDHMTRGRVMFGVGPGALISDAFMIGIDAAEQRRRMDEALDVHRRACCAARPSPTRPTGSSWTRPACSCMPYSRPTLEIAVASPVSPIGRGRAGQHGLGLLSLGATSDGRFNALAEQLVDQTEEARTARPRRDRRSGAWSARHIAETREQARADVRFGLDEWQSTTSARSPPADRARRARRPGRMPDRQRACLIGTPDDAAAHSSGCGERSGGFGAFLLMAHNWADWEATKRSYELMARYVFPHFQRQSNALRVASYDNATAKHETAGAESAQAVATEIERYEQAKGKAAAGRRVETATW